MKVLNTAFERAGYKYYSLWRLKFELSFAILREMGFDLSNCNTEAIVLTAPMCFVEIEEEVLHQLGKMHSMTPLRVPVSPIVDDAMRYYEQTIDITEWPNLVIYIDTIWH